MLNYIIIINLITFIIYYLDKRWAIKNKNRVSENTLLFLSLIGGSIGAYLSMNIFRHKTKKIKFKILIPLMIIIQIIIFIKIT